MAIENKSLSMFDNVWIFDFDGTLFDSTAKVYLTNPYGKRLKSLTREEYYSIYKNAFETTFFDYTEYENPEIIKEGNPLPTLKILKQINEIIDFIENDYGTIYILTARRACLEDAIFELLQNNGISTLKRENVITTGEQELKTGKTRHILKKEIIAELRKKHTGLMFFIDDEEKNLEIVGEIPNVIVQHPKNLINKFKIAEKSE